MNKNRFWFLIYKWETETSFISSTTDMMQNQYFKEIVSWREDAIPFILDYLQKATSHIYLALFEITGENPVPTKDLGKVDKIIENWLEWGYKNGYIE